MAEENTNFSLVGEVKYHGNKHPKEVEQIMKALQKFMNEHEIVRMDLSLNPFQERDLTLRPQGNIISTKN